MKFAALATLLALVSAPAASEIVVTVDGIESEEGTVRIGLFAPGEDWPNASVRGVVVPAHGTVTATVTVPAGRWAIAVFHDADADGVLDTNFFGIPSEGYGFSRGAKGGMSAPDYDEAAFVAAPGVNRQRIKVEY